MLDGNVATRDNAADMLPIFIIDVSLGSRERATAKLFRVNC